MKSRVRAPARPSTSGQRQTLRPLQMILTHSSGLKICEFGWLPCRPEVGVAQVLTCLEWAAERHYGCVRVVVCMCVYRSVGPYVHIQSC